MQIITIYDFLLLPVYLFIFFYLVKKKADSYNNPEIKKIFFTAFFLRMFGSVAFSLLIQYYYGYGDAFTYYSGSDFLHGKIIQDPGNIKYFFVPQDEFQQWYNIEEGNSNLSGYMAIASNNMVMKISALVSFFAFNKFLIISLFFGLFSFAGQWKLFEVFNDYNKGKLQKLMAFAVLYSPSIWFWGSGLMKDSLCLGAMGFIVSILYVSFIKKQPSFKSILLLPILIFLVFIIKSYIIAVFLISLGLVLFVRYVLLVKSTLGKIALVLSFILAFGVTLYFIDFSPIIDNIVEESFSQIQNFSKSYQNLQGEDENSRAAIQLENLDNSLAGLLAKAPGAVFTCLYRPFLWESKKIIILFTSIESTLLLLATLFLLIRLKFIKFFAIIFSNRLILFSLVMSLLFALIIGFTTFNFGTMIRYKVILLPFYYFMLVAVFTKLEEQKSGN